MINPEEFGRLYGCAVMGHPDLSNVTQVTVDDDPFTLALSHQVFNTENALEREEVIARVEAEVAYMERLVQLLRAGANVPTF